MGGSAPLVPGDLAAAAGYHHLLQPGSHSTVRPITWGCTE